jgi:hypothetical protein
MAPNPSRAELVSELAELHGQQLRSMADATFVGWTSEQLAAHQKRSDRISQLQRDLDARDGTPEWPRAM